MENIENQPFSLDKLPFFRVILLAAGKGNRYGGTLPKQFELLAGKPLFLWSLEEFLLFPHLKELCLVTHPDYRKMYEEALSKTSRLNKDHRIIFIDGGETRSESVRNALEAAESIESSKDVTSCEEDRLLTLIHDAARPFIRKDIVAKALCLAAQDGAVSLSLPVADTLRRTEQTRTSRQAQKKYPTAGRVVERDNLRRLQTPQIFRTSLLKTASSKIGNAAFTDETQLLTAAGYRVSLIDGYIENIKITTQDDMIMAKKIAMSTSKGENEEERPATIGTDASEIEIRIGQGFDVHAFEEGNQVTLCGVSIPHSHSLKGHSDADVGIHSLVDAILGALAMGDIGDYFPPSDAAWKGADSIFFLKKAMEFATEKRARLENIDITFICQEPKIGPYKEQMKKKLSTVCKLECERINIKATTTEGLGFTGRGEGIAALVVISMKKKGRQQSPKLRDGKNG